MRNKFPVRSNERYQYRAPAYGGVSQGCYECGEMGHFGRDSPRRKVRVANNTAPQPTNEAVTEIVSDVPPKAMRGLVVDDDEKL